MADLKLFRVRWPKSRKLVADADDILEARDLQRETPGTAIYKRGDTEAAKESLMSFPIPEAPKEPRCSSHSLETSE